jgi:hypothetical protein
MMKYHTILKNILLSAPRLTMLSLRGHYMAQAKVGKVVVTTLPECLKGLRFLKDLKLTGVQFEEETLSELLVSCSPGLKKLLLDSIPVEHWSLVFATIAGHFELSSLYLTDIREGVEHTRWVDFLPINNMRPTCRMELIPSNGIEGEIDSEAEAEAFMIVDTKPILWSSSRLSRDDGDYMSDWISIIIEKYALRDDPTEW